MEKGLRIPDIMMLYGISRLYGVHMDALISLDIREHLMSSIRGCSEKTAIFDFSLTLHHPATLLYCAKISAFCGSYTA